MNDGLDDQDCINVVRGGRCTLAEIQRNALRYRIATSRICVVVEFEREDPDDLDTDFWTLIFITCWREKQ